MTESQSSHSQPIKAVTFDVGGTLISPWPSVGHVYAEIAEKHGFRIPPGVLNKRFGAAWKQRLEFNHTRDEWKGIVTDTFGGLMAVPSPVPFFDEIYDRFAEATAWRIHEDTLPAIEDLDSRGIRLGIISNWDERLRPLLKALKLGSYFESIVISCEMGFTKPSEVLFEEAARKLGVPPSQILHVGDSMRHDGEGAKKAGFQWRIVDRAMTGEPENVIKSLMELGSLCG